LVFPLDASSLLRDCQCTPPEVRSSTASAPTECQRAGGEGPRLAAVRDAKAVAQVAREGGEGSDATAAVIAAAAGPVPRGDGIVEGCVGEAAHWGPLLQHPVVHPRGGAGRGQLPPSPTPTSVVERRLILRR